MTDYVRVNERYSAKKGRAAIAVSPEIREAVIIHATKHQLTLKDAADELIRVGIKTIMENVK